MVMMIDTIAERYGILPSEVMTRATTFDLFIADAAIGYRNIQQQKANNQGQEATPNYSQDELIRILKESRGEK